MPINIDGSQYLYSKDIMENANISRTTLWRWRKYGLIPEGRLHRGRQIVYTLDEFEQIKQHANRMEPARMERQGQGAGQNASAHGTAVPETRLA
jgi:hypothetical protein